MSLSNRIAVVNGALAALAVALGSLGLIPHVAGRTGMIGAGLLCGTLVVPALADALAAPPRWLRALANARRGLGLSAAAWMLAHVTVCVVLKLALDATLLRQLASREVVLGVGAFLAIAVLALASARSLTSPMWRPYIIAWALPVPALVHGYLSKAFFDGEVPLTSMTLLALGSLVAAWQLATGQPRGRAHVALVLVGALLAAAVALGWPADMSMNVVAPHLAATH